MTDRTNSVADDNSVNGDLDPEVKDNEDEDITIDDAKFHKKDSMKRFGSIKFRGSSDSSTKKKKKVRIPQFKLNKFYLN